MTVPARSGRSIPGPARSGRSIPGPARSGRSISGPVRFPLAVLPTPLVRADRLERALHWDSVHRGPLLLKRDDLAGFGVAGNKTRPLEYLVGAALAQGADVLVTGGGPGSNFCPAAALAARAAGLDCELVVWGELHGSPNLALAAAAGACVRPTGEAVREAVDALIEARAAELERAGRRPFAVPRGGSTALGAVGFAVAAAELDMQCRAVLAGPPALVVLPVGSGGSCAGLLAAGPPWPVLGVSVSRPPAETTRRVRDLAAGCAALLGQPPPGQPPPDQPPPGQPPGPGRLEVGLEIIDARGPGFGVASAADRDAARLALHTEGLLLDDTYGAKAFAVTVERLTAGVPGPVVYWHTGGVVSVLTASLGQS